MCKGRVVGHVPRMFSKIIIFILVAGGRVDTTVTGRRANVRKNGLEVPCTYEVKGPTHAVMGAKALVNDILKRYKRIFRLYRFH